MCGSIRRAAPFVEQFIILPDKIILNQKVTYQKIKWWAISPRTDDQIFGAMQYLCLIWTNRHKEFEKRMLLCETKVNIPYKICSSRILIILILRILIILIISFKSTSLKLSAEEFIFKYTWHTWYLSKFSTLVYGISFYFSEILTGVAIGRKTCKCCCWNLRKNWWKIFVVVTSFSRDESTRPSNAKTETTTDSLIE